MSHFLFHRVAQNWICCLSAEVMIYLLSQRDLELSTLPQKLNMGSYTWNQTKKIWCTSTRFCKEGISIHEALKGHICSGWQLLVKLCNPPKLRKEVIYIREALKGHVCWGWHLLVTVVTVKLCTPTKRASRLVSLSKAMSAGDDKSCLEKQRYNLLSPLSTTNVGSKIAKSFFSVRTSKNSCDEKSGWYKLVCIWINASILLKQQHLILIKRQQ